MRDQVNDQLTRELDRRLETLASEARPSQVPMSPQVADYLMLTPTGGSRTGAGMRIAAVAGVLGAKTLFGIAGAAAAVGLGGAHVGGLVDLPLLPAVVDEAPPVDVPPADLVELPDRPDAGRPETPANPEVPPAGSSGIGGVVSDDATSGAPQQDGSEFGQRVSEQTPADDAGEPGASRGARAVGVQTLPETAPNVGRPDETPVSGVAPGTEPGRPTTPPAAEPELPEAVPETAGRPEDAGRPDDAGDPDLPAAAPDTAGQPDDAGRPDDAGQPELPPAVAGQPGPLAPELESAPVESAPEPGPGNNDEPGRPDSVDRPDGGPADNGPPDEPPGGRP